MANYFDYSSKFGVYEPKDGVSYYINGLSYTPDFYPYKNYYKKYIIKPEHQYRPDKIAFYLFGDEFGDWILDRINSFTHGIEEYYAGREILYLERDALKKIGAI